MSIVVRDERDDDANAIREVTIRAFSDSEFGHNGEAELVDRLRDRCPERVSLVAEIDGRIVGHVLFTPVAIEATENPVGMGLGPISVLPSLQRKGIGRALIEDGLKRLSEQNVALVVVLGDPVYYQRFGFEPAKRFGLRSEFDGVPEECFQVLWLNPDAKDRVSGLVRYRPEFSLATDDV